jgi:hypothetical protein
LAVAACSCSSKRSPPAPLASSSASPSAVTTAPSAGAVGAIPADRVAATLNPKGLAPYSGPTGTLRGAVHVKGDEPPVQPVHIPPECGTAAATYGKLFRVGQDKTLGDVLVAVTGYEAYVPPKYESVDVPIRDCAYSARTYAATFGQYLSVRNTDERRSYLPLLEGGRSHAGLVAIPLGQPIKLYAPEPKMYRLVDQMARPFMSAWVFVLRYSTHAVTGLDGRYEIPGIPVGEVEVSALLPEAGMKTANQRTQIKPGDNTLDITIEFDAKTDVPKATP